MWPFKRSDWLSYHLTGGTKEFDPNAPEAERYRGRCISADDLRRRTLGGKDVALGAHDAEGSVVTISGCGVAFEGTNLKGAHLFLDQAGGEGVEFHRADLRGAAIHIPPGGATFVHCKLDDAIIPNLGKSRFIECGGLVLDGHDVSEAHFGSRSYIPWLILRRKYTGIMAAFHLLLAGTALTPYFFRVLVAEVRGEQQGILRIGALLGWGEDWWVFPTSVVLVSYNFLRLVFTWWLSQLREEEVRSRQAPFKKDYWRFWLGHQYFIQWVEYLAILLAVMRTLRWCFETI